MQVTTETLERGLSSLNLFTQESPEKQQEPSRNSGHGGRSDSMPSSSSMIGDYIGMESCVDVLKEGEEYDFPENSADLSHRFRCKRDEHRLEMMMKKKKVFPPPIPLLARTENLPCRMPWVLRRDYTSDGRLILTEEKVLRHEYFRAHRSNGRLTLQLVPLDDDDDDDDDDNNVEDDDDDDVLGSNDHRSLIAEGTYNGTSSEDDHNKECNVDDNLVVNEEEDGNGNGNRNRNMVEESKNGNSITNNEGILGGGNNNNNNNNMCLNYSSVRGSCSCVLGMAVPAIKTVHS
ncbi:target of rapamycin complex 2 subunit AVO1 [Humulus lupulus]|uniref:target of rapamycin complex 2 subunit AVO1 n=1 Tax=Humulus lupulus TaxID=3486 RepID=UPI002B40C879|nr:target of rapamycin complex 2 subunit AVO1 [Humulus lupulus]